MYILIGIIIFGLLIIIHEFGHFIASRIFGVRVNEFSVGMGPAIFKKQGRETLFSLRALPFGGYCAIEGEDGASAEAGSLALKPLWQRLIVMAAGSAMNFIAGFLVVLVIFSMSRYYVTPEIAGFMPGQDVSAETGLMEGDRILSVNGRRVNLYNEFNLFMSRAEADGAEITVLRGGKRVDLGKIPLVLRDFTENGETVRKYGLYFRLEERNVLTALRQGAYNTSFLVRLVWMGLSDLVSGSVGLRDMSGAVGTVAALNEVGKSAETVGSGILNVVYLGAFIAVNLAVMNMLPIPGLDGGHIFTMLVSGIIALIIRRRPDPRVENYIHAAGLGVLFLLMIFLVGSDIFKLIQ